MIRTLKASEIECRVQQVKDNGFSLLLYIDSRACVKLLNETYGWDGWQRTHHVVDGKLFCKLQVWSDRLQQWIIKEDVGTESSTEKQKGQVSDSLKRAVVNLGVTELYSADFIWIKAQNGDVGSKNGKPCLNFGVSFSVRDIAYNDDREIVYLVIVDAKGNVRYTLDKRKRANAPNNVTNIQPKQQPVQQQPIQQPVQEVKSNEYIAVTSEKQSASNAPDRFREPSSNDYAMCGHTIKDSYALIPNNKIGALFGKAKDAGYNRNEFITAVAQRFNGKEVSELLGGEFLYLAYSLEHKIRVKKAEAEARALAIAKSNVVDF